MEVFDYHLGQGGGEVFEAHFCDVGSEECFKLVQEACARWEEDYSSGVFGYEFARGHLFYRRRGLAGVQGYEGDCFLEALQVLRKVGSFGVGWKIDWFAFAVEVSDYSVDGLVECCGRCAEEAASDVGYGSHEVE